MDKWRTGGDMRGRICSMTRTTVTARPSGFRRAGLAVAVLALGLSGTITGAVMASPSASHPKLPSGFPKPPGSSVGSKQKDGKETLYSLTVKSEPEAYKYWKKELPKHGWKIHKAKSKNDMAVIEFTGHGYTKGNSTYSTGISIINTTVSVGFFK
jgi:hypothetical protein